ncbi:hypothetical protein GCM10017783_06000 [Deinococcus piscis]|uniref:Uncharacterized protein n=1 Tax=Deinococcus piscis TaxID=394230 RepID=A0ABQ3JZC4_9DEIO|nr:hypothetical protein [Deinococcus piscis]GHF96883.1 hypothetical protein GCM10017783_06000 [Deinococcus piscis]
MLLSAIRFWLGLNVVLLPLILLLRAQTPQASPLTPAGVLWTLGLSGAGFALGLAFARFWPLSGSPMARAIRTALITLPAMGLAMALTLTLQPPVTALILPLAAFLGSQWRLPIDSAAPSTR